MLYDNCTKLPQKGKTLCMQLLCDLEHIAKILVHKIQCSYVYFEVIMVFLHNLVIEIPPKYFNSDASQIPNMINTLEWGLVHIFLKVLGDEF